MTGTRIESADRPLTDQWSGHIYIDHRDLRDWSPERIRQLTDGLQLVRLAVAGPRDEEEGE